jgi:hypothetical protein
VPLQDAFALERGRCIHVEVIRPAFACAGTGRLRVVRVNETSDSVEFAAAYEGYDRL